MNAPVGVRVLAYGRMAVRAGAFVILSAALVPPYLLAFASRRGGRARIARLYFRGCLALTGLRLKVSGPSVPDHLADRDTPILFVANHVSYLDIPVLGALRPGTFIAKGEVSRWPVFGPLARISGTIFISRMNATLKDERNVLAERLSKGENLFLFPEGTSSDGNQVGPFKSALFFPAHAHAHARDPGGAHRFWVQPVSIAYSTDRKGRRLSPAERDCYAWYGDMEMLGHLVHVFTLPGAVVEVRFHAPLNAHDFADRKALAKHCHDVVAQGLDDILERAGDKTAERFDVYGTAAQ